MRALLRMASVVSIVVLLLGTTGSVTAAPGVRIKLLNELPKQLAVGESYTIDIRISCDEPFILAMGMIDAYYPGRGVFRSGPDHASRSTQADLHLTLVGKESTADLPAVVDWPTNEDWPGGVAPLSLVVGIRIANGQVVSEQFTWAVTVP